MKFNDIIIRKFNDIVSTTVPIETTYDVSRMYTPLGQSDMGRGLLLGSLFTTFIKEDGWYSYSKPVQKIIDDNLSDMITRDQIYELIQNNDIEESGCIINDSEYTFFTMLGNNLSISIYDCSNNAITLKLLYLIGEIGTENTHTTVMYNDYTSDVDIEVKATSILNRIVFKRYVNVETVIVNKDNPTAKLNSHKYTNKSKFPITVIDSTWYRNIIRTEAFGVRGHFRLQPHGEGMQKRKLKWISPYTKNGYSRHAKKGTQIDEMV